MSNTIESIEQGNELIARFMGAKPCIVRLNNIGDEDGYECDEYKLPLSELRYHTSYDWLMPVVEKIETLVVKTNITSNCVIIRVNEDELNTDDVVVSYKGIMSKIEAVWQAVVQFIEWYNNQKSNQ